VVPADLVQIVRARMEDPGRTVKERLKNQPTFHPVVTVGLAQTARVIMVDQAPIVK
jgi:hypothetical protein